MGGDHVIRDSCEQVWRSGAEELAHELACLFQRAGGRAEEVRPVTEDAQRDKPGNRRAAQGRDVIVERLHGKVISVRGTQRFDQLRLFLGLQRSGHCLAVQTSKHL